MSFIAVITAVKFFITQPGHRYTPVITGVLVFCASLNRYILILTMVSSKGSVLNMTYEWLT